MIIGSDVIYWPQSIIPLCNVLQTLFTNQPELVFYVCYIERITDVHKALLKNLDEYNMKVEEVGHGVTKLIEKHSFIYKVTKK